MSAQDVLRVWEAGEGRHIVEKALALLAAACPDSTQEDLAGLSVGRRDARLLELREATFGAMLDGFAQCPACAERLEFVFAAGDIRAEPESGPAAEPFELAVEGLKVKFRLPDSRDLAAAALCQDAQAARSLLIERSVLEAGDGRASVPAGQLPAGVADRLAARIAELDPQADVLLDLACPACGHRWRMVFDIARFLWAEVSAQAKRMLREVDALARAYGWREADILALSAARRQAYLDMVS